jgi:hypothetical protein
MSGLAIALVADGGLESKTRWLPGYVLAIGGVKLVKGMEVP